MDEALAAHEKQKKLGTRGSIFVYIGFRYVPVHGARVLRFICDPSPCRGKHVCIYVYVYPIMIIAKSDPRECGERKTKCPIPVNAKVFRGR